LPKDVAAIVHSSEQQGYSFQIGKSILSVNDAQRELIVKRAGELLDGYRNRKVSCLGLAFKAGTDDTRESPAIHIVRELHERGCRISAFDPSPLNGAQEVLRRIDVVDDPYDACRDAELILVLTEWPQFKELDFEKLRGLAARPMVYDTRNLLDPGKVQQAGFFYIDMGRTVRPSAEPLPSGKPNSTVLK
jgi:UDPglucose 6-dehydrogenase